MYIARIPNRGSPPATLLRESYRENGKVKTRTLANLSRLPDSAIEALRQSLQGRAPAKPLDPHALEVIASPQHGHVQAVLETMRRLGMATLIHSRPSPARERVLAMIAARVLEPHTKLATVRWWHTTTLPSLMGVSDCDEDELYEALDWLLDRQPQIEKKLAARHLRDRALALYDLSSSYVEGTQCPLAAFGYNRDGKRGKQQINYGLLTAAQGVPIAVSVFPGNVADPRTVLEQVEKCQQRFALSHFALVGDRGMITQTQVKELKRHGGVDWISALRPAPIRQLLREGALQLDLFDERNLFSFSHLDFPGERLIACRNPALALRRRRKRESMLAATASELEKVQAMVERGRLRAKDKIGVRVGRVVNKYKVAKHFRLDIDDDAFAFAVDQDAVAAEAALDGLYVIRTSLDEQRLGDAETVRSYKSLSQVERAFRSLKSLDLQIRPLHHWLERRVRAHILLCMLAYYVQWHMRQAWRPLLFADEDMAGRATRDPVAPATRSAAALHKAHTHTLDDGTPVHSFRTLMRRLGGIVRNTCRAPGGGDHTFDIVTTPDKTQRRALDLLKQIAV